MKITLVQNNPIFESKIENTNNILRVCSNESNSIIVFPELTTSGYFYLSVKEIGNNAISQNDDFFNKLKEIAITNQLIICLGYAEKSENNIFNSAALIFPNGSFHNYRKTHLFYKEKYVFSQGDTGFNVFEYKPLDVKIGVMICYDWRFPEAARSLALQGVDLILCPSNLVTDLWFDVMKARAIENNVFIAVANRIGTETREINGEIEILKFKGQSVIFSPKGDTLAIASADEKAMISCEIEPFETRNKAFNSENDIFLDRRPDMYL